VPTVPFIPVTERLRIAVLGGGRSCEHEVSLATAAAVAGALDPARYDVVRLGIGPGGDWWQVGTHGLRHPLTFAEAVAAIQRCDVVFPALHGPHGEDGSAAALSEFAGVPYVGSGVGAGALAMDKWATKLVARAVGIDTAPAVLVHRGDAPPAWRGRCVVKPVAAGSSRGVTLVDDEAGLVAALAEAFRFDTRALVEDVVCGREVDVAVLALPSGGYRLSPTLEIVTEGFFDYDTKYGGGARFAVPARLDRGQEAALEAAAVRVAGALGVQGVARVDFFVTDEGPVLNEVNTIPGMTEQSQVPRMFAAAGLPYADLLDLLVAGALARGDRSAPRPGGLASDAVALTCSGAGRFSPSAAGR
jgi:D-alanine-D-alanine ligase